MVLEPAINGETDRILVYTNGDRHATYRVRKSTELYRWSNIGDKICLLYVYSSKVYRAV